jgi:CheY-like chemotaxis protein
MMLSSAGQGNDAARCRELGITAYLTKPIKQSELFNAIVSLIGAPVVKTGEVPSITPRKLQAGRRSCRILLAEDNHVNQRLAVRLLEKEGHTVVLANNGREAVARFEKEPFDLILMDVQMPELNGYEATRQIRSMEEDTGRRVPIIAMTAHAMKGDRERCLDSGMDGYVSKPIKLDELFGAIEALAPTDQTNGSKRREEEVTPVIDKREALSRVNGDAELLAELAELFLKDYPQMMGEIEAAIGRGDGEGLSEAAHAMKGSVGNFGTKRAYEEAARLERMGQERDLKDATEACNRLASEIERLRSALNELIAAKTPTPV